MRGDLVYEKLGEIDPALVADALPETQPTLELYTLGGGQPAKPPRGQGWRKALVVCACLVLAALLLVGGGIVMSRSGLIERIFPSADPVTEQETDDPNARYKGIVTITVGKTGETVELADDPTLEALGMDIKKLLNQITAAEPSFSYYTMGDYILNVGGIEVWLSVDRSGYMFMEDTQSSQEWELDAEMASRLEELINCALGEEADVESSVEPPVTLEYTYRTLYHKDVYTCSLSWSEGTKYGQLFEIEEIYLRSMKQNTEYRTDSFKAITHVENLYYVTIPEDAPYGDYELVVLLYSPYTGRNLELEIGSSAPALTVSAHEKEPAYSFFYEAEKDTFICGEDIVLTVGMTNEGDTIHRFTRDEDVLPEARIRTVFGGETVEYTLEDAAQIDWYGQCASLTSGESAKGEFYLSGVFHNKAMPLGEYDLILSFEGQEQVFANAITVTEAVEGS